MLKIHAATAGVLAGALLLTGCSTETSEQKTVPAKDSASKTPSPKPSKTKRPKRTPSPSPTPSPSVAPWETYTPTPRATKPRPTRVATQAPVQEPAAVAPAQRVPTQEAPAREAPAQNPASITRTVLKPEPQVPHPYTGVNLDIGLSWIETMMASPANGLAKRRNRNPSDEETKLTLKAKPPCPGSA